MRKLLLLLALTFSGSVFADPPPPDLAPVKKWIEQQREVRTIQADFVQTRALRILRSPVSVEGRFWFRAPASFRWQVGSPPKTILLTSAKSSYLIQPAKKIAEKSFTDQIGNVQGRGFGMMRYPLATDFAEFQRDFQILSVQVEGTRCRVEGLPRNEQARRYLAKITFDFDTGSGELHSFEAVTREGSSLRSDFHNVVVNGEIFPGIFDYDFNGYKVTDAKP